MVVLRVRGAIAVIPARGGSKRLPRKNMIDFMGRPMLAHTILAARGCDRFDRIIVSTEDSEIARVAEAAGAEVPFLRDQHADDTAPVSLATLRAVEQAQNHFSETYETVVQLMPNCPLRGHKEITAAMWHFDDTKADFLISAFRFGWMNPWWAATLDDQGHPKLILEPPESGRSQDLPPLYCASGAIWVARNKAFTEAKTFFGSGHIYFELPWDTMVDVDDADDLAMAEVIWERRHKASITQQPHAL